MPKYCKIEVRTYVKEVMGMKKRTMKIILATILVWLAFIAMSKVNATTYRWPADNNPAPIENIKKGDVVEILESHKRKITTSGAVEAVRTGITVPSKLGGQPNGKYWTIEAKESKEGDNLNTFLSYKNKNGTIETVNFHIKIVNKVAQDKRQSEALESGGEIGKKGDGATITNDKIIYDIGQNNGGQLSGMTEQQLRDLQKMFDPNLSVYKYLGEMADYVKNGKTVQDYLKDNPNLVATAKETLQKKQVEVADNLEIDQQEHEEAKYRKKQELL